MTSALSPLPTAPPHEPPPDQPLVRVAPWGGKAAPVLGAFGARNVYDTRLDRFLARKSIKPAPLARACGYSRQHLLRVRSGTMRPTTRMVYFLIAACIAITGDRTITANDLFNLEPSEKAVRAAMERLTGKRLRRHGDKVEP